MNYLNRMFEMISKLIIWWNDANQSNLYNSSF